ncbi:flagellar hook-basal body complex protein FliE [Motilimonas cestriensis]
MNEVKLIQVRNKMVEAYYKKIMSMPV